MYTYQNCEHAAALDTGSYTVHGTQVLLPRYLYYVPVRTFLIRSNFTCSKISLESLNAIAQRKAGQKILQQIDKYLIGNCYFLNAFS
jgi:hypothetical protein